MRKTRSKPDARRSAGAASRAKSGAPTNDASRGDLGAIEIDLNGGALVATLKRPRAQNRISHSMARELMDLAETVEDDDAIMALALNGRREFLLCGLRRRRRCPAGGNARAALKADRRDPQW